jgi:hypothetical protein
MMNRLDVGNGDSIPLDIDSILPGDYVKCKVTGAMGRVGKIGILKGVEGYIFDIVYPRLERSFIALEDIQILGI